MRLFVALELPDDVKANVIKLMGELSSKYKHDRFVEPENLHFTLKFIGDIEDSKLDSLISSIEDSISGIKPFKLHVQGMGYFGSRSSAFVTFVDVKEGKDEIMNLAKVLDSKLSKFRKDERPPRPHLTICRPKGNTSAFIDEIMKMSAREFGWIDANRIVLKKSTLTPERAIYEDVKDFKLGE